MASGESNGSSGVTSIANWLSRCRVSSGNTASAVALASAEALIIGQTIVSEVEHSEVTSESVASAVVVKLSGGGVNGTVGARAD